MDLKWKSEAAKKSLDNILIALIHTVGSRSIRENVTVLDHPKIPNPRVKFKKINAKEAAVQDVYEVLRDGRYRNEMVQLGMPEEEIDLLLNKILPYHALQIRSEYEEGRNRMIVEGLKNWLLGLTLLCFVVSAVASSLSVFVTNAVQSKYFSLDFQTGGTRNITLLIFNVIQVITLYRFRSRWYFSSSSTKVKFFVLLTLSAIAGICLWGGFDLQSWKKFFN